jgi:hypothetical protein
LNERFLYIRKVFLCIKNSLDDKLIYLLEYTQSRASLVHNSCYLEGVGLCVLNPAMDNNRVKKRRDKERKDTGREDII